MAAKHGLRARCAVLAADVGPADTARSGLRPALEHVLNLPLQQEAPSESVAELHVEDVPALLRVALDGPLDAGAGIGCRDGEPVDHLLAGPETAARTRVSSVELAVTRGLRMAKGLDEVARPLISGRAVLAHARQEIGPAGLAPRQRQEGDDQHCRRRGRPKLFRDSA